MINPIARWLLIVGTALAAPSLSLADSRGRTDYIGLHQVAASLGLKEKHPLFSNKVILADQTHRVELKEGSREALVDGQRVFLGDLPVLRDGQLYVSRIDFDRALTPMLRPDQCNAVPPRPRVIVLDPGHGGIDNGAENKRLGLVEKECALDVAFRLKKLLEQAGWQVVLTRDRDIKIELAERAAKANRAHADLFLSIHFNSLPKDTKTNGSEIFTFTPQFQLSTRAWSPGEADDSEKEAAPVNRFDQWSAVFSKTLGVQILTRLKTFDRGKKTAHFGMLRGLNCPGALIESGFISNEAEGNKIATPQYRQQIAEAMLAGIRSYSTLLDSLRSKTAVR